MERNLEQGMVKKIRKIREEMNKKLSGKTLEEENKIISTELEILKQKREKQKLAQN